MAPPIDRGWSWMVCLGCHVVLFLVVGMMRVIGIIFVEIQETFHCTSTETSLLLAILSITVAVGSPAANALAEVFSNRVVIIIGAFFTAAGFIVTHFAQNIATVIFSMGLLNGIGISFQYSTSMVMIGRFFEKRRSLANGIAMSGGSVGQLIMPVLLTHLIEAYAFRGAILVMGGLMLNAAVGAMLFTPMSFYRKKSEKPRHSSIYIKNDLKNNRDLEAIAGSSTLLEAEKSKSVTSLHTDLYPVDFNAPLYASTGSLYFGNKNDLSTEALREGNKSLSEVTPQPYNPRVKVSLKDMLHAVFCCCITCKDHGGPKMWDWGLFKNALFLIYVVGTCTGNAGYVDMFMFVPPYFKDIGLIKRETALLLAIGGGFDLIGRLIGGWFADLAIIKRHNIMSFCMTFTGIAIAISLSSQSFVSSLIIVIILGFTGGFYMSLFSLVIIDFLGLEIMPLAFGMSVLIMCLVNTFLPTFLGMLCDLTQGYQIAILVCCVMMVICGISFGLEPVARWYEKRRLKKQGSEGYINGPSLKVGPL